MTSFLVIAVGLCVIVGIIYVIGNMLDITYKWGRSLKATHSACNCGAVNKITKKMQKEYDYTYVCHSCGVELTFVRTPKAPQKARKAIKVKE